MNLEAGRVADLAGRPLSKLTRRDVALALLTVPAADAPEVELFRRRGFPHHELVDGHVQPCNGPDDVLVMVAGGDVPSYAAVLPTFYASRAVTKAVRS